MTEDQILLEFRQMNQLLARIANDLGKLTGPKPISVLNAQPSKMDGRRSAAPAESKP